MTSRPFTAQIAEAPQDGRASARRIALSTATSAERFRFARSPCHPVVPEPTITLRPEHGTRMTVHRRG